MWADELETLTPPPAAVRRLAAGAEPRPVWVNPLGGVTWALPNPDRYVKWQPAGRGEGEIDLVSEAARMRWAARWTAVPEVLDVGAEADGTWLVTAALAATSAVDPRWAADYAVPVRAAGAGLRAWHDRLPVTACPWDWSVGRRLRRAEERRAVEGDRWAAAWAEEHQALGVAAAVARLGDPPPVERAVVCHGDACAPNTLLDDDGRWVAHVDVGHLGVADRWADLAVATWSLEWNFGPGWEDAFYDAYGVDPDPERVAYYRLLWDLA